ncbi:MAG: hypothetical protein JSS53_09235 [Proteobacteria bacterium]|nr:hypothetical protein [Pseudomonadota bacterium]
MLTALKNYIGGILKFIFIKGSATLYASAQELLILYNVISLYESLQKNPNEEDKIADDVLLVFSIVAMVPLILSNFCVACQAIENTTRKAISFIPKINNIKESHTLLDYFDDLMRSKAVRIPLGFFSAFSSVMFYGMFMLAPTSLEKDKLFSYWLCGPLVAFFTVLNWPSEFFLRSGDLAAPRHPNYSLKLFDDRMKRWEASKMRDRFVDRMLREITSSQEWVKTYSDALKNESITPLEVAPLQDYIETLDPKEPLYIYLLQAHAKVLSDYADMLGSFLCDLIPDEILGEKKYSPSSHSHVTTMRAYIKALMSQGTGDADSSKDNNKTLKLNTTQCSELLNNIRDLKLYITRLEKESSKSKTGSQNELSKNEIEIKNELSQAVHNSKILKISSLKAHLKFLEAYAKVWNIREITDVEHQIMASSGINSKISDKVLDDNNQAPSRQTLDANLLDAYHELETAKRNSFNADVKKLQVLIKIFQLKDPKNTLRMQKFKDNDITLENISDKGDYSVVEFYSRTARWIQSNIVSMTSACLDVGLYVYTIDRLLNSISVDGDIEIGIKILRYAAMVSLIINSFLTHVEAGEHYIGLEPSKWVNRTRTAIKLMTAPLTIGLKMIATMIAVYSLLERWGLDAELIGLYEDNWMASPKVLLTIVLGAGALVGNTALSTVVVNGEKPSLEATQSEPDAERGNSEEKSLLSSGMGKTYNTNPPAPAA